MEDDPTGYPDELWKQMIELDLVGLLLPSEYGGSAMSCLEGAILYRDVWDVVFDDLDRCARFLLHARQDLESATAAIAPERVRTVSDVLQFVEDEPEGSVDDIEAVLADAEAIVEDAEPEAVRAVEEGERGSQVSTGVHAPPTAA